MDKKEILKHIDHTLLKAVATWEDIKVLCDEAIKYDLTFKMIKMIKLLNLMIL